jgi:hypothetical protein
MDAIGPPGDRGKTFGRLRSNRIWLETYFLQGGMEAVHDDISQPVGFLNFAPVVPARGPMFGTAARGEEQSASQPVLSKKELYGDPVE